jgi:hypothetical protein
MALHPDVMLLGSAVTFVDTAGQPQYTLTMPLTSDEIRRAMHLNCAFIHPTVMWRCSAMTVTGHYPVDYPMAEDYALFWRFVESFATENLPMALVSAEINASGLSIGRRAEQLRSRLRLQLRYAKCNGATVKGIVKTLVLMVTPYSLVLWLKRRRGQA